MKPPSPPLALERQRIAAYIQTIYINMHENDDHLKGRLGQKGEFGYRDYRKDRTHSQRPGGSH
jgi:hypothetical protein